MKIKEKIIHRTSQAGKILAYLQRNPDKEIMATAFMWICFRTPFVWHSANSRLSELKNNWFVEVVWEYESKTPFKKATRNRLIFKITTKGLLFNLN